MQEGGQAVLRVGADDVHVVWEVDRVGGNYLAPRCVENRCFGGEGNDVEHFTIIPKRQGCLVACPVPVDTFDLHNPAFQPLLGSGGNADLWENAVEVEYQIENIYQRTTCQHSVIEIRERKQFAAIMQKKNRMWASCDFLFAIHPKQPENSSFHPMRPTLKKPPRQPKSHIPVKLTGLRRCAMSQKNSAFQHRGLKFRTIRIGLSLHPQGLGTNTTTLRYGQRAQCSGTQNGRY